MSTDAGPSPAANVAAAQRFTRHRPCPICGGHAGLPRGQGRRCHGFLSSDGRYAHCSREERAGPLPLEAASATYAHRLAGDCRCGERHGPANAERGTRNAEWRPAAAPAAAPRPAAPREPDGTTQSAISYPYYDADGQLAYEVIRKPDKQFLQRAPDGKGGWQWSVSGVKPVLYRLVAVMAAEPDATIYIVEGEKDADALTGAGLIGTTNPGGAGKWRDTLTFALRGRHIVILPDNDAVGRRHAEQVAESLAGSVRSLRVVELPDLPPKGDVSDWLAAGGTAAELRALVKRTPLWRAVVRYSGTVLADVAAEEVAWLSPGRLARGKITVLDGDPGLGKSTLVADWAARLTTGRPLPGGAPAAPAGVVLLSAEDGLADTIRPRLEAAGADLTRVYALTAVGDDGAGALPSLPDDLSAIEEAVARFGAALLVIDPLMAYLGADVQAFRDQDVRRALAPLAALAERAGVAVLVIRHLNKITGGAALYRGGGSIGIIGAARCGLLVAADPDDPERRILAPTKSNLAVAPPALAFRLAAAPDARVAHVEWLGQSTHRADALLAQPADDEARDALDEACAFLRDLLANGPVTVQKALAEGHKAGIADRTLRRAKVALRIQSEKAGFAKGAGWLWSLPGPAEGGQGAAPALDRAGMAIYGEVGHLRDGMRVPGDPTGPIDPPDTPPGMAIYGEVGHLRDAADTIGGQPRRRWPNGDTQSIGGKRREVLKTAPATVDGQLPVDGHPRVVQERTAVGHLRAADARPAGRCPICDTSSWYRGADGAWTCGLCTPPWGDDEEAAGA